MRKEISLALISAAAIVGLAGDGKKQEVQAQNPEPLQGWITARGWVFNEASGQWEVTGNINGYPVTPNGATPTEDLLGTLQKKPWDIEFTERQGLAEVMGEKQASHCYDPVAVK